MEDNNQLSPSTVSTSNIINDNSKPHDESIIDVTGAEQKITFKEQPVEIKFTVQTTYSSTDYNYQETRLGDRYKQKLELKAQEVSWLNKFWDPTNVFLVIEGCC